MVVNEFEDDYKSDECDEHTAIELFYKAAFNDQSISISCEDYVKSRKSFSQTEYEETATIGLETAAAAEIALCLDKPEPIVQPLTVITVVETKKEEEINESKTSAVLEQDASDNEGIAAKLEPRSLNDGKLKKKTRKSSQKLSSSTDSPRQARRSDESLDSDDINANIKPKRKRVKAAPLSQPKKKQRKDADAKSSRDTPPKRPPGKLVVEQEQNHAMSMELPTLSPELSSDDEITLSDTEGIELNVVSFGRGIPDKVTMKKKVSPGEHKRLWHVDVEDKFRHLRRNRYHTAKECRNCRRSGHLTHECPLPERIVCIICAETTHLASRCPDKICSFCKNEGHTAWRCFRMQQLLETKCRICNLYGHRADICPDSWRRYHCTTVEGPPIAPEEEGDLPRDRKFCSWCGRQGHFAFECKKASNAGIASRLVHSYREPSLKSPKSADRKRTKKEKRKETSRAEQGRAAVFGGDFIPIAAGSKKFKAAAMSQASQSNSAPRKNKATKRSIAYAEKARRLREEPERRRNFEPDSQGIDMLPSVLKRKRKNGAEASGEKPLNRRKERRKLKRMQDRGERDKIKKKASRNK